jgi:hypothetical protein
MKFDKDFEEDVLACCMRSTDYLKRASRLLESHHFHSPQHGWVWKALKSVWDEFRERANGKLLLAKAARDYVDDDERLGVIELTKRIGERAPRAGKATLEELTLFVKFTNAQLAFEAGAKALEKGDVDKAYEEIHKLSRRSLQTQAYTHQQWIEHFTERLANRKYRRDHPEEFPRVPTGFKKLDHILSGGLEVTEVGMVLATTGRGKSICLANMCYSAVARGIPCVYFSMEMPAEQIGLRHDARWLNLSYRQLKEFNFKPSELAHIASRLKCFKKRFANKLHIISTPLKKCDINLVRSVLDDLWDEYKFRPRAIFLDSADHMSSVSVGKREEYRLQQSGVYWEIADLAGEEGYAIWTSTQAGRDWADKIAEVESAGESYDKARIVDVAFSLNAPVKKTRTTVVVKDGEDDDSGETKKKLVGTRLELRLGKYRDGKSMITIPIDADFARMHMSEIESDSEEPTSET